MTGKTGVAQSPVIVMNELRSQFLLPGAYTPRKCVHGCTQSVDTKDEGSSDFKIFVYSLSGNNFYHPVRDANSKSKI
jgi:hypothetical protein